MTSERQAWPVGEFCAAFGICRATFYNEVRRGRLRAVKLGAKTLVLREDAEAWANKLPVVPCGTIHGMADPQNG